MITPHHGKEIWNSGLWRAGDAAKGFSLDVKGVKSLVLLATRINTNRTRIRKLL